MSELQFSCDFEGGNLGQAHRLSEFEYDISIRTDSNNPRYALWFYFRVDKVQPGQLVFFNIINFSKTRSLFRNGMSPVVRSTSRPDWTRLLSKNCFYYRSNRHKRYCLSFLFAFDKDESYWFAYGYPYSYTHLQHQLWQLEQLRLPWVHRSLLCRTEQQRRIDLITITSPDLPEMNKPKRTVFITARVIWVSHCLAEPSCRCTRVKQPHRICARAFLTFSAAILSRHKHCESILSSRLSRC